MQLRYATIDARQTSRCDFVFLIRVAAAHACACVQTSALVTSEWYMRNGYFPGWARPYEFAAELLSGMKRLEEARDMSRWGCVYMRAGFGFGVRF